jgi:hypothetical protein
MHLAQILENDKHVHRLNGGGGGEGEHDMLSAQDTVPRADPQQPGEFAPAHPEPPDQRAYGEHYLAQDGPAFAIDGVPDDFVPPVWMQSGCLRKRTVRPEHGVITGVNSDEDSEELYREVFLPLPSNISPAMLIPLRIDTARPICSSPPQSYKDPSRGSRREAESLAPHGRLAILRSC